MRKLSVKLSDNNNIIINVTFYGIFCLTKGLNFPVQIQWNIPHSHSYFYIFAAKIVYAIELKCYYLRHILNRDFFFQSYKQL